MTAISNSDDFERKVRRLAQRKGYILRRAEEGKDLWHIMKPEITSALYSFSLGNPHSYTLAEAERVLKARQDARAR